MLYTALLIANNSNGPRLRGTGGQAAVEGQNKPKGSRLTRKKCLVNEKDLIAAFQ